MIHVVAPTSVGITQVVSASAGIVQVVGLAGVVHIKISASLDLRVEFAKRVTIAFKLADGATASASKIAIASRTEEAFTEEISKADMGLTEKGIAPNTEISF